MTEVILMPGTDTSADWKHTAEAQL